MNFSKLIQFAALACLVGCTTEPWHTVETDWRAAMKHPTSTQPTNPPPPLKFVAGQPLELSIEQAVVAALANNRELMVQQLEPNITATFEDIQRSIYDPQFYLDAQFGKESVSESDRGTGEQFSVKGRDASFETGLRQTLPTGTDVELSVSQDRTISNRSPEQQEARVGLTVTQSLLRGFGPSVNLARIEQAKLDTAASVYELRRFTEALLARTETAYWQYVLAREEIDIFERSLEIAQRQRDEVQQQIEVGVLPQTQAAAARTEVALRQQALINARSALEDRRLRLMRLITPGSPDSFEGLILTTSFSNLSPQSIQDAADRVALAQQSRPELNEAKIRLEQDRLETVVTRNGLLPRLDFFVTVGKSGFADTFVDSFSNMDDDAYDFTAGVSLSQALGNRAARARDLAARTSRRQAAAAIDNLKQLISLDVHLAINEVERLRQQITATAATRALQEQTADAEQQRLQVGSSTSLLVAQAQRDLLASHIAEVEAIINYRIALVNLYLAEGSLLERRGVTIGQSQPR